MAPAHSTVWWPRQPVLLELGQRRYDLTTRALIIGILNRTPDSFYDHGAYFSLDRCFEHAEHLVREGADLLDVGGIKAGPGPEVTEEEELDRVVPVITSLRERFDVPLSVDTWRASVAAAAFEAGAVVGNDISGFADPGYLPAAAAAGASVVATHIRLSPRVPDPDPALRRRRGAKSSASCSSAPSAPGLSGIPADRIVLDAGLDLGKTAEQSLLLLAELCTARRRSATRCSCPRRTRPSWGFCWASRSVSGPTSRWPRWRWGSPADAGS